MSKMYYVNGSTVRELGVPEPVRRERQGREEIERARREKNARLAVRRNREKAQGMSRGYVAFLSVCVILSAVSSFILISPHPDTQQVPIPLATTAACEVIPPRTVKIP